MKFSTRLPVSLAFNPIARELETLGDRTGILDLTETNPTRVGLHYPVDLLKPLAQEAGLAYRPDPMGLRSTRAAIAQHYARSGGGSIAPERIVLCASTSEAYSWLFKLLCNPGDVALAPRPGYPLFDGLADLEAIRLDFYDSHYDGQWAIDLPHLQSLVTPTTRIVLTVSPNNPTGALTRVADQQAIEALCAGRGLALVCDEVFSEYLLDVAGDQDGTNRLDESSRFHPPCLTFRLGGLSKLAGLPQLKLAWIRVDGPNELVEEALRRLEFIADTFLSVGTPIQLALPELLENILPIRDQILDRIRLNLDGLKSLAMENPALEVLRVEGGWAAVLRVPTLQTEEDLVLGLLHKQQVLVHPGYFFNIEHGSHVVLSLLPEPGVFTEGLSRLGRYFA